MCLCVWESFCAWLHLQTAPYMSCLLSEPNQNNIWGCRLLMGAFVCVCVYVCVCAWCTQRKHSQVAKWQPYETMCRGDWPSVGFLKWWTGGKSNPIRELVSLSLRARPCLPSGPWLDDMILKVRWIGLPEAGNKWNGQREKERNTQRKRLWAETWEWERWMVCIAGRKYTSETG